MKEAIMAVTGIMFMVLFTFLSFIFFVFIASIFKKKQYSHFEPEVSIIVPTFNEEKNIKSCLESIFSTSYPKEKLEVIVVDDGSTDNTVNMAKNYKIKLLKQNHQGKSEALNLATSQAKHNFILTIDADTTIEEDCIKEIVKPFTDPKVGATTGISKVKNNHTLVGIFQNIEYHYNNLIRNSFSKLFNNGIWFFGALACYRKDLLKKIGYFKKDTLTEDMDIALEIRSANYTTINVHNAVGKTIAPKNIRELYHQRSRWWIGVLQALVKNKKLFSPRSSPAILFLFINQFWWTFYAFISLPAIIFQVNYWLPYNSGSLLALSSYLFRWFSLLGPIYVIYKIPIWGLSYYSFFGVLSGIISAIMIISAIKMFKDRLTFKNMFALFFYFPYTIVLNIIILFSLLRFKTWKNTFFIN